MSIKINQIIPDVGLVENIKELPKAWFNIVPYLEVGLMTAIYLEKEFNIPYISVTPMGLVDTSQFVKEIGKILNERQLINCENYADKQTRFVSQAAWFSRSIDCQNLTGKKSVVFGDATNVASMTKILSREMGIQVCCFGIYCKHDSEIS